MTPAEHARHRMTGHRVLPARRSEDDGAMSVQEARNARRIAEYEARVNGVKEPLIRLWRMA